MTRQTIAAAFAVFLLAGAGGWLLGRGPDGGDISVSSTTIAVSTIEPAVPSFMSPTETVLGPAVLVAKDLRLDGEQISLEFEMANLAPVGDAASVTRLLGFGSIEEVPPTELNTVYPDKWVLLTAEGEIPGSVATPEARTARFDVGRGFSIDAVTGVRLVSYGLMVPIDSEFSLALDSEATPIVPGVNARLLAVTEQSGTTIIQIELISERAFNFENVTVAGVGAGWKSTVREAEGRPRWNLTYDSPEAPSPLRLRLHGAVWMTVETEADVYIEEGE